MKSYDETPWWCQLLWPWFGPPWYAEIEDPDSWLDAIRRQFARQAGELADELAGDDRPGEGYLAKAGRLSAARHQAEEIIRHEYAPLTSDEEDNGDEDDEPTSAGERPVVIGRDHPSWAEVDAERAILVRTCAIGSSGVALWPARSTTNAFGRSPHLLSGTPMTAASSTAG